MKEKLRILFIEDEPGFPESVLFRIHQELKDFGVEYEEPEILTDGEYVWETVRDWKPHIIMMDHNLENVKINGANLIIEIRFHNNETPIIFYSSEMDQRLMNLVDDEPEVYPSTREDVNTELLAQIKRLVTTIGNKKV
jgi:DNA-binding response OmpR family regulator